VPAEVIAEVAGGWLRGARRNSAATFRGVPYASAGRWRPPGPALRWTGTRDALASACACPQPDREVARFTHGELPPQSEDCLHLHVYTPQCTGSRPVMVWLHGGGFAVGHPGATLYDGAALALAADVVVVAVGYRLGSLGWLCHPELATAPGAPSGNWGLLDQIAALQWVHENVAAFGGDPGRVTVAGQSAGALCALDLLLAPGAQGLFARLILQSPPLRDVAQLPAAGLRWARALSRAAGGSGAFDGPRLHALAATEIVSAHETVMAEPEFAGTRGAIPTLEPVTLPRSPLEAPGARPEVEVLVGSTAEEGTFFFASPWRPAPPPERIAGILAHLCPGEDPREVLAAERERAAQAGRPEDEQALLVAVATERMVSGPVRDFAHARAAAVGPAGGRVYRYRIDHRGATGQLGATHTVEVPLLFGTWRDGGAGERLGGAGSDTEPVAEALRAAWGHFLHGEAPGWAPDGAGTEVGVFGGPRPFAAESVSLTASSSGRHF
jgi:para-nitrobenzyl esterase